MNPIEGFLSTLFSGLNRIGEKGLLAALFGNQSRRSARRPAPKTTPIKMIDRGQKPKAKT